MAYSRQLTNTEDRNYLVRDARAFFVNNKSPLEQGGLSDTQVYKVLGEIMVALREERDAVTDDIAGFALAYIYNNYLTSSEKSDFQTETSLS
jgi:hypothetical protein